MNEKKWSPQALHDLPGDDAVKEFVDFCMGIVKPLHDVVGGCKPGLSPRLQGEDECPDPTSRPVDGGPDRAKRSRDIRAGQNNSIP